MTRAEVLRVVCETCGAPRGKSCRSVRERFEPRREVPPHRARAARSRAVALKPLRAELREVQDKLDALYWDYTRRRRGRPPAMVAPELYVRCRELAGEIRKIERGRRRR